MGSGDGSARVGRERAGARTAADAGRAKHAAPAPPKVARAPDGALPCFPHGQPRVYHRFATASWSLNSARPPS